MAGTLSYTHSRPLSETTSALCGNVRDTWKYMCDGGYYVSNSTRIAQLPALVDLETGLRAAAETKALANLRQSINNVPLVFMERQETIDMVKRKGLQLVAMTKARQDADVARWLRTRKRDQRRLARDIAGEHLAFLFGLLPLVGEIEGLVQQLSDEAVAYVTGRGRMAKYDEVVTKLDSIPNTATMIQQPFNCPYTGTRTASSLYSYRTSIRVSITSAGAKRMRDNGFNPIATAYDLVPLSFLFDFVSNLGTFLRAYDPLFGVSFITGSSTLWRESKEKVKIEGATVGVPWGSPVGSSYLTSVATGSAEGTSRALYMRRYVLTDFPSAELMWVNNMSLSKAATIASLAIQRYLKPLKYALKQKEFRYRGKRPRWLPPIRMVNK